jgi:RHS repeat-associated protein
MRAMVYDTENRLTCVVDPSGGLCTTGGATVYAYDPDGQRVAKTTGTGTLVEEYVYDFSGNQVSAHNSTSTLRNELYAPNGRHVATYGSSILTYNFADWLGTERVRFNSNGTVSFTDMPYGMNLAGTGGDTSAMHFTDKPRDTETGLDYFGARFNASNLGRFMTPDWSASPQGVPYADFSDPQTLNLYSYVRNNPMSHADADGHDWWDEVKGFAVGTWNFTTSAAEGLGTMAIPVYGPMKAGQDIGNAIVYAGQEYYNKGVSGVANQVLDQGEQGAMEVVTQAVLTGGAAATARVDGVTPESWGAPDSNVVVRGGQGEMPPQGTTFSGAQGATLEDAAQGVPHGQVRESTAGQIRDAGGSVRSKPEMTRAGNLNEKHVNVREGTKQPSTFSQPKPNPVPKKDRIQ